MKPDARFLLVLGCFLLSGTAGLIYQTAWTQQFALTFGASELAVVAVLAAYMAGLTAGAAAAARWLGRVRRPVLAYGLLEMGIAVCALAVPAALGLANRLQVGLLGGAAGLPEAGGLATIAFHMAASFLILLPPTALMGATLPLLARYAVERDEELGTRVGVLYTVNTMGAALGTLGAGFVLLPAIGLARTVWVGVALNALAFLLAVPLFRSAAAVAATAGEAEPLAQRHVLPLMLVSSAVSFTYEVLWTRLLTFVLGGSVYAFSTMLASFLVGIAVGAAIAARAGRTGDAARRGFVLAQLGAALLSLGAFRLLDRLPHLAQGLAAASRGPLVTGAALCALTLLPGAVCIGTTFPFAVRMLAAHAAQAGPAAARAYAWSTVGAVVGAVAGCGSCLRSATRGRRSRCSWRTSPWRWRRPCGVGRGSGRWPRWAPRPCWSPSWPRRTRPGTSFDIRACPAAWMEPSSSAASEGPRRSWSSTRAASGGSPRTGSRSPPSRARARARADTP